MNSEEQIYQLIESYLNGSLQGKELEDFENNLKSDPDLQRKLELSKAANELVIENRLLEVKNILQETHNNTGKGNWGYKSLFISGGLLIIGTLLYTYTKRGDSENNYSKIENSQLNTSETTVTASKEDFSSAKNTTPIDNSVSESKISSNIPAGKPDSLVQSVPEIINNKITETAPVKGESEDKKTEGNSSPTNSDPCKNVTITADISPKSSCIGEESGSILVSGIKGGTSPYRYQIKNSEGNKLNSGFELKAGIYSISITDNKGCNQEIENINIKEKQCPKDYSFNPFIGENWNIPYAENSGSLIIYDHSGRIYYQKELNSDSEESWNGYSGQGELQTGYFIFTISYKSGAVVKGSITIVR